MKTKLQIPGLIRRVMLIGMLMASMLSYAHAAPLDLTITGKVTDDQGNALLGVSVSIKGTSRGTATDGKGAYSLTVPDNNAVLVFTYVGFIKQEVPVAGKAVVDVQLVTDSKGLGEVIVIGYGTQKKESVTGAISAVTSKDLERVHASTVSATLAGKIPGVTFRMPDGRPGAGANIQIRNLGNPLYVIDGIQKDAGQFNNISPNDIETITVLKDASAAIYGVRAANGVVVVTTKRGKAGSGNSINVDAYTGWQNWSRFPKTVNAYEWMLGKADAEMNAQNPKTDITREELDKWKAGTEPGYKSFDWYDFIIKKNAPQHSINVNATGGTENINYYLSVTRLDQKSVLGREFDFNRTNFQSNVDAKVAKRLKVGVQLNGRIEERDNPGVPGGDDYWAPRFALFRNRPTEHAYANDNPAYPNDIGHNTENWAVQSKAISGYWTEDWRVLQTNFNATYETPIKGLTLKGMYSYYYADRLMNGHEYTYDTYTFHPADSSYERTGGSSNPWRERGTHKVLENVLQGQVNYNNTFGKHTIGATFVSERIKRRELDVWVHAVPKNNVLPLLQFADMDTYNDKDWTEARLGYIGRLNYNYADKYFLEAAGRYDGSWKFAPDKRWGFFPSVSAGWRMTEEPFFKAWLGGNSLLSELKLRASYGELGDDDIGIGAYDYLPGYTYATSTVILDGQVIKGSRDKGVPNDRLSWFTSKITDIGLDYQLWNGKVYGSLDYFKRKRSGLRGSKYDVLVPNEIGYGLPQENVNSDQQVGGEFSAAYTGKAGKVDFVVGGNVSYSRSRFISSYKPVWGNSLDYYRNSGEDRWSNIYWGYEAVGQFQSQEEINKYPVNVDGQGNKTLLPGDIIYKDVNGDGVINGYDERPIGYQTSGNPTVNFGLNLGVRWKGIDFSADFSGGSLYSYNQNWEMRWPFQNGGNLLKQFYDDRWHREDPFDVNSKWIPGKYPALRFNDGGHSNYNKASTFWLTNVHYVRLRTMEIGYTIPQSVLDRVKIKKIRVYLNTYNLFSIDNVKALGIEPEIADENGLQYPQNKLVNVGFNLTF
ncbi:TonB-dependent receptor [Chitinophaga sp. MM2321]|uniref:SusC/RagA family TonB-linked outer membrane protein n=1 Tax=Chitinophaga sp. MM2321 TaxID=3137178 RepID=UPI0032D58379